MNISGKTKICMVIGDPIEHSLSPKMHNSGYKALGFDGDFVYIASKVRIEEIDKVSDAIKTFGIRGVSLTMPHKQEIIKYLDNIDDIAKKIGAVNTVVNDDGRLTGYNTDWLGVVTPLEKITNIQGKKVAVVGAGGAARAAVFGVLKKGGQVKIFNRSVEKAQEIAQDFVCQYGSSEDLEQLKEMDIIFNATSIGMKPNIDESPIPIELIESHHIVFDAIYSPHETKLLTDAKQKGAQVIHGIEMLLHQGTAQFEMYTGLKAPEEEMRTALMEEI